MCRQKCLCQLHFTTCYDIVKLVNTNIWNGIVLLSTKFSIKHTCTKSVFNLLLSYIVLQKMVFSGLHIRIFLPSPIWRRTFDSPSPNSIYHRQICEGHKITFAFFLVQINYEFFTKHDQFQSQGLTTTDSLWSWSGDLLLQISRPTMVCPHQI